MNKPEVCPVCGSERSEYEVAFKCGAVMRSCQDGNICFSWQCPHVFEKLQQAVEDLKTLEELVGRPWLTDSEHALWHEINRRWGL